MPKGKHGKQPKADQQHRWAGETKMMSDHGYVKLRVGVEHPLADPNGYAYEHLVVWVSAGNPRPKPGWLLHHKNEVKTDNRLSNLELKRRDRHGIEHQEGALTDEQIREIRALYASGEEDTKTLAKLYGYPEQTVWKWVRGYSRASAGGIIQTVGKYEARRRARAGMLA